MRINLGFKNKRKAKLIGIGALILGVLIMIVILTAGDKPIVITQKAREKVTILKDQVDLEEENWRATAQKDIDELKKELERLKNENRRLQVQDKQKEEQKLKEESKKETSLHKLPPSVKSVFTPPPPPERISTLSTSIKSNGGVSDKISPQIRVFTPETSTLARTSVQKTQSARSGEEPNVTKGNWIPSGSFVQGIILSGLDAPTGVEANSNPHPVLIRLTNPANLPNLRRLDVKECFVTGGGYGDLASERAHIRLERLSCVLNSGRMIDSEVKGFVSGEDGKEGLRGRLVSKQGTVLAKAGLASFIDLVGDVFGSVTRAILNKDGEVVIGGGGVQTEGFQKLVDYYLKYADLMFPIIEIDSGRTIDVVILQGKELKPIETLASAGEKSSKEESSGANKQNSSFDSGGIR